MVIVFLLITPCCGCLLEVIVLSWWMSPLKLLCRVLTWIPMQNVVVVFFVFFLLLHISMHPYSLHLFQEYTTVCAHTSWNSKNSEQHRNGQLSEQRKQFFHAVSNILKTVTLLVHAGIVWRFRTLPHSGMDYRIFNVRRRYFCMCIQLEGLKFFLTCLLLPLAVMFRGLLEWTTKDIKVVTFCAALFPALRQTLCTLIACDSK